MRLGLDGWPLLEIKTTKLESFIIGCVLGAVPVMFCFVTAWFASAILLDEKVVPTIALSGLGVGMVIDVFFLKRWIKKAYQLNNKVLVAIYIFYSIGVLGFYMGVPILNFGVGILAGIYTARRAFNTNAEEQERSHNIKKTYP